MTTPPQFTPQQITAAIRSGLREGRQSVEFSPSEAETKAAVYRSNLAHYRRHVQKSLDEGDYLQAAEKSWGAYAQAVKAIAADNLLSVSHHASIIGVAGRLAALVTQSDADTGATLTDALLIARSMHIHFYENDLPDETVIAAAGRVASAVDMLQEMFPPLPPANRPRLEN